MESNAFLKFTKHIQWLLVLMCLVHQYYAIRDLVSSLSCPPSLSESHLFVCNFCFDLHTELFTAVSLRRNHEHSLCGVMYNE